MRRTFLLLCATVLLAAGCTRPAPVLPVPPAPADPTAEWPQGRDFVARSITESGRDHRLVAGTSLSVRFRAPGELAVEAGCNSLGVRGRLEGARLVPTSLYSTAIACDVERSLQDRWVIDFFNAGPTWELDGGTLTLRAGTTEIVLTDA